MNILPIKTLEKTFNRYLSLDSESNKLLTPLIGKVMGLHITRPKISIYFSFHRDGAQLSTEKPVTVNTDIHATLFQLMRLKANKNAAMTNTQFYINGDVDTAQLFNELLQNHHIDWEENLSKIIGDVTAHKMMQLIKKPTAFFNRNKEKFTQDVTEYCQEEAQFLPSSHEVAAFQQEVDGLRLQIDRLDARVDLLKKNKFEK